MNPNDDLLPSAAEITIESSNRDPGMRGSLIGFIGDDDVSCSSPSSIPPLGMCKH